MEEVVWGGVEGKVREGGEEEKGERGREGTEAAVGATPFLELPAEGWWA